LLTLSKYVVPLAATVAILVQACRESLRSTKMAVSFVELSDHCSDAPVFDTVAERLVGAGAERSASFGRMAIGAGWVGSNIATAAISALALSHRTTLDKLIEC
jgi:hypothetical protein